jgi:RND family efflux transporter MFP subunit
MRPTLDESTGARGAAVAALLVATLALAAGCGRSPGAAPRGAAPAPVAVETIAPDPQALGQLTLAARVKARQEATVAARATGRVTALLVREGESVREGQPLARFDAPESRQALAAAGHELASANAARDVARRQAVRLDSLFAHGSAAARERELADSEREAAEARAQAAAAARAEAQVAAAPTAPFAGVIVRRHVDAGADVAAGAPLFDLRSRGPVEIVVPVPEAALGALAGAHWTIEFPDGAWRTAKLTSLDGMTDPATRTRTAHLAPVAADALEPGSFVRVQLSSPQLAGAGGSAAAIAGAPRLLPQSALVRRGALRGAFVIAQGRAELRWLKLGRDDVDPVEVLAGLFPGERVARNAHGLTDGAAVTAGPAAASSPTP